MKKSSMTHFSLTLLLATATLVCASATATEVYSFPWANAMASRPGTNTGLMMGGDTDQIYDGWFMPASNISGVNPVWVPTEMWSSNFSWYDTYGLNVSWTLALHNPNGDNCSGTNIVKLYLYAPDDVSLHQPGVGTQVDKNADFFGYHPNASDRLIKWQNLPSGVTWNDDSNAKYFEIEIEAGKTRYIKSSDILHDFSYAASGDDSWSAIHLALEVHCEQELDTMLSADLLYKARTSSSTSNPTYNACDEHASIQYWGIWNGEYTGTGNHELTLPYFQSLTGSSTEDDAATIIYLYNPTDQNQTFECEIYGKGTTAPLTRTDRHSGYPPGTPCAPARGIIRIMPSQLFYGNSSFITPIDGLGHIKIRGEYLTAVAINFRFPETTRTLDGKKTKQTTTHAVPFHVFPVTSATN